MYAVEKLPEFRATVFALGKLPEQVIVTDLMSFASAVVSAHPEDWCLDPSATKRWVICHAPMRDEPVNTRVSFLAGQVVYGNAIVFDYAQMADNGFLPPEGE